MNILKGIRIDSFIEMSLISKKKLLNNVQTHELSLPKFDLNFNGNKISIPVIFCNEMSIVDINILDKRPSVGVKFPQDVLMLRLDIPRKIQLDNYGAEIEINAYVPYLRIVPCTRR